MFMARITEDSPDFMQICLKQVIKIFLVTKLTINKIFISNNFRVYPQIMWALLRM